MMKYIINLCLPLVLLGIALAGCEKEELSVQDGEPVIYYIRTTNPETSDSLLVGSFMGSLVAIVGDNLGTTREAWFNDQQARLNPAYITDKTIIVNVPSTVPSEVTNKLRLVFADGSELLHDFSVNVPAPIITGTKSEYVPAGGTMVLEGDFFFEPKVIFPGDVEGDITSLDKTRIEVTVPAGAEPGPVVVRTNFGKATSPFLFRDDRNVLLNFDDRLHETWTAPIARADQNPPLPPVDGNYAYFKNDKFGAWQWINDMTMQYWAPRGRGNVPVASGPIQDLVFKFEANVPIPWHEVRMEIILTNYVEGDGRSNPDAVHARWRPWLQGGKKVPYKTDGWETISIPLTEFKFGPDDGESDLNGTRSITDLSKLTNVVMMIFGPADGTNPIFVAIDNVRIVKEN